MFEYHHDPAVADASSSFWFVAAISNPERYRSRWELYKKFRHHVTEELGANLITVECAHGERDFQVTSKEPTHPKQKARVIDVQVRNSSHCWLKENLYNIAISRLPDDADYLMFCDADIQFQNRNIVTDTIHALQTHKVVQPFETAIDLGPHGEVMELHKSFGWCHNQGMEWKGTNTKTQASYYTRAPTSHDGSRLSNPWHPGFALAMRRRTLAELHGVLEVGILGAGDHHMLTAFIGKAQYSMPKGIHPNYRAKVMAWQDRATAVVKHDLGYVRGPISHFWHGRKALRQYRSRWSILLENNYDPAQDAFKNLHGVFEIHDSKPKLRDDIRRYFRSRVEDGIDTT